MKISTFTNANSNKIILVFQRQCEENYDDYYVQLASLAHLDKILITPEMYNRK